MSKEINLMERSIRKKNQKSPQPTELLPCASNEEQLLNNGTIRAIPKEPPRETLKGALDKDCLVEVSSGEKAMETVMHKGHRPSHGESAGGSSGEASPGGDPALCNVPTARPCRSDCGDSEDSCSEDGSGSSLETESSSSTDSDESDSSQSSTEEADGPPQPDTTVPDSGIKKELAGMSFEELLQLQNKVGTKLYNQMAYGPKKRLVTTEGSRKKPPPNKNRPMEISAKKPVPFLRRVVPAKKKVHRDPRFDDLSGEYKPEVFEKTYSFINDIKKKEKKIIEKKLKKTKDPRRKEELQQFLQRLSHQEKAEQARQKQRERDQEFKKQQREMAKQGKKPFFLKKSEQRTLELADKYKDLKKSGKLESFLSKKRKRNAGKDKRRLPFQKGC